MLRQQLHGRKRIGHHRQAMLEIKLQSSNTVVVWSKNIQSFGCINAVAYIAICLFSSRMIDDFIFCETVIFFLKPGGSSVRFNQKTFIAQNFKVAADRLCTHGKGVCHLGNRYILFLSSKNFP